MLVEGWNPVTKSGEISALSETNKIEPLNNQRETNTEIPFIIVSALIAEDLSRIRTIFPCPNIG